MKGRTAFVAIALCGLEPALASGGEPAAEPPTVLTFRGLLELEADPKAADEDKRKQWEAFIARSREQISYAEKAVDRWKNAPRIRAFEAVQADEVRAELGPRDKLRRWTDFMAAYPKSPEAKLAERRAGEWRLVELRHLSNDAEEVERSGVGKLERVRAHKKILEWSKDSPEGRTAQLRLNVLSAQLLAEAKNLDRIRGVARATRIEVWKDVLEGTPSPADRAFALRRIAELEAGR